MFMHRFNMAVQIIRTGCGVVAMRTFVVTHPYYIGAYILILK
jgi:hypothetical protein